MTTRAKWIVALLLVVGLGLTVATVDASDRDDDRKARKDDGPVIEAVALEYQPVHAAMETLGQLLDQDLFDDVRDKIALAVNEPANAVVIVGPPEAVEKLSELLRNLDEMAEDRQENERERSVERLKHMRKMREEFGEDFERMRRGGGPCPGCRRRAEEMERRERAEREQAEHRERLEHQEMERREHEEREEGEHDEMRRRRETEQRERMHLPRGAERMRPREREERFEFRFRGPDGAKSPQLREMIEELREQMDFLEEQRDRMHNEMRRGRRSSLEVEAFQI